MNTSSPDIRSLPARLVTSADQRRGHRDTKSPSDAPASGGGHTDAVDPADRAAFGDFLRQARERRQMTVQQIADDTKIAPRHLTALEQGNVKSLPGGMYRRAMLRAYADSVGLDKEAALEQFERTFEPPPRTTPGGRQPLAGMVSRAGSRDMPRHDSGQAPRHDSGQAPRHGSGQAPRHGSGQAPRTGAAQLDGAGLMSVAATQTVDPPAPVATRSARSRRGRDMGVLLAVVIASAVAVVGLVTGDGGDARGTEMSVTPPRSAAADEASTQPARPAAGAVAASPAVPTASAPDRDVTEPAPAPASAVVPPRTAVARPRAEALPVETTPAAAAPAISRTSPDAAATPPPSVPRATTGQLVIATTPPGARVTVNGTGWGMSPVTVRHLPFGSMRIRVTHDGYLSQERVIALTSDRPAANVSLTLSPRK